MWWKQFKTLKIQFSPPFCSQEKIKSSVEIFCIFRYFIAKIIDKTHCHSVLLFFVHWKSSFVIFSFTNWFSHWVLFIAPALSIISQSPSYLQRPGPGDYRSKEAPDPPLWSKYADKKLSPTFALFHHRISSSLGKRLNRKIISENLGRKIMTLHSSPRLNFSFNPGDYPAKSLFMRFSSFSDHATSK